MSWLNLGKISIDQLNLKKFNPRTLYKNDEEDDIYLDEYEIGSKRIKSTIKPSISVAEEAKKRVKDIEKR